MLRSQGIEGAKMLTHREMLEDTEMDRQRC